MASSLLKTPPCCLFCHESRAGGGGGSNVDRFLPCLRGVRSSSRIFVNWECRMKNHRGRVVVFAMRSSAVEKPQFRSSNTVAGSNTVEIPVTCYQIIGVTVKAEKDEIVKSVMELKRTEIEEGYTMDTAASRQVLLMDVRDKLLFEPEYAGNVKETILPKSSLRIPLPWLPAALCLLQEVGEEKLVLDIGRSALQRSDSKPYTHDLLLSMALAECAIAKACFEKNNVSHGFEALARAQCLLRSKTSLAEMALLSQIEESLEDLAPICTLELLGIPRTPENAERRRGAISALRELVRQGLDVESSCQVEDWTCFLGEALKRLLAAEVVDLLPWDNLAVTRKNKKSLESQNQRIIIDSNCFYMVLLAYIALGFSSKQTELVMKAKTICECLMVSEVVDLKLEEAFCLFLLEQGSEAEAVEKLKQLELNANPASRSLTSGDKANVEPSLERWLKDAVLSTFPDTRDCPTSLANFFCSDKRTAANRRSKGAPQVSTRMSHRPLSANISSDQRTLEEPHQLKNSSHYLGSAVKELAQANLSEPVLSEHNSPGSNGSTTGQLKRTLGAKLGHDWKIWFVPRNVVGRLPIVAVSGCILFTIVRLSNWKFPNMSYPSKRVYNKPNVETSSITSSGIASIDRNMGSLARNDIAGRLKQLLGVVNINFRSRPNVRNIQKSYFAASLSSPLTSVYKRPMTTGEAESLVKQWQATKAEALGPSHQVSDLLELLEGPMLVQWQALADAAKAQSCFWRFVVLQLSVLRAEISCDGKGDEVAEIDALIEEAAELVDESQPKNPTYYSTYKIRYILRRHEDGIWRFHECEIETISK